MSFDHLDALIREQIERDRLPGLAIALVRGDEIVWSRGYGCADLDSNAPVTPSTVFSIQSVTKTIVTTALMQWHERGAFDLDARVNDYLAPLHVENEWEPEAPVTIRGLLTHSAGLPVSTIGGPGTPDNPVPLEEYINAHAKTERRPGEQIVYANVGFNIAGWLLGKLAGKRYDVAIREQVLDPLGMRSTGLRETLSDVDEARSYVLSVIDDAHHQPDDRSPTAPAPSGGLCSTVEDMARFLIAHLNHDKRILREETFAAMHALQVEIGDSCNGMGLGFRVADQGGRPFIGHGGDGFGFSDFIGALPQEQVGVALLINMGPAHEARATIGNAALRALLGEPVRRARPKEKALYSEMSPFTGHYEASFWGIEADISLDDGSASISVNTGRTVQRPLLSILDPLDGLRFSARGGFFDGWEITFERGKDGTPTFSGGIYPWFFTRTGDVVPEKDILVDEDADLSCTWTGVIDSPMGSVPTMLTVSSRSEATIDAMTAHGEALRSFRTERGRVEGDFGVDMPGLGPFDVFLRLVASDGKLLGTAYARGAFGEVPMPAELVRG